MHHLTRYAMLVACGAALAGAPLASAVAQTPTKGATKQADKARSAPQIIDAMVDKRGSLGVSSGQATLRLLTEDRTGDKRARTMELRAKKVDGRGRTLVKLTSPKEVAGQSFLFAETANEAEDDDVWMYLPAFGVTRRVEGSQKRGSFMGTHFSFADLESRDVQQADLKRLDDETIGAHKVYVIEATPKRGADSEYGRVVVYVRQSDEMLLKMRFYDKDAKTEAKTLFVEKIGKTASGSPTIEQMTLRSTLGGYTTIVVEAANEGADLPDTLFLKDQLGK